MVSDQPDTIATHFSRGLYNPDAAWTPPHLTTSQINLTSKWTLTNPDFCKKHSPYFQQHCFIVHVWNRKCLILALLTATHVQFCWMVLNNRIVLTYPFTILQSARDSNGYNRIWIFYIKKFPTNKVVKLISKTSRDDRCSPYDKDAWHNQPFLDSFLNIYTFCLSCCSCWGRL